MNHIVDISYKEQAHCESAMASKQASLLSFLTSMVSFHEQLLKRVARLYRSSVKLDPKIDMLSIKLPNIRFLH